MLSAAWRKPAAQPLTCPFLRAPAVQPFDCPDLWRPTGPTPQPPPCPLCRLRRRRLWRFRRTEHALSSTISAPEISRARLAWTRSPSLGQSVSRPINTPSREHLAHEARQRVARRTQSARQREGEGGGGGAGEGRIDSGSLLSALAPPAAAPVSVFVARCVLRERTAQAQDGGGGGAGALQRPMARGEERAEDLLRARLVQG